MTFWSGPTIEQRLSTLVDVPDPSCVDGAAYMLKVGSEYYVTPTDRTSDPKTRTLQTLAAGQAFAIPPGQFAYVMTQEVVTIPNDVLAFISVRARVKWKGLVNVSGFHVDPGYQGRLTFAVFNAGPAPIHLRQGDPTFLIWFANLDADAGKYAKQQKTPVTQMDVTVLNHVAGELNSLEGLAENLRTTDRELRDKINDIQRANGVVYVAAGLVVALVIAIGGRFLYDLFVPKPPPAAVAAPPAARADVGVEVAPRP